MSSDSLPIVRCYVGEPHGPETWPVPKQWIDLSHNYVNAGACTPLENSSHFVLGTRRGVYQSVHDEFLHDLDTRPRPHGWRTGRTDSQPPFRGDVLAVDYLQECPQVVLAGTRSGHICQLDLRTPAKEWESKVFRHKSSVAHIKAVGPYNILAAGPRNAMCIYDIRFTRAREQKANQKPFRPWEQHAVAPAVEFPGYRNDAYIKIGLDVLNEPGYGHGVVAAAHDDCTVGLYSVRDGSRISSPDVDKIKARGVIKAMMFQTLPDDQHPSLFVGVGPVVQKFSF
ncbi:hypothetical protein QBC40DRAFT_285249 [Triangularia verruculosa]|uniref:Uncharacterized protein n=1 Tax=Triangularia verruculosa TaxID=2587418 RepID=A0AAN6XBE1_9PEZI|nr:hypothetical protein QBC40DRAFT_285249 [Triangularia verruculosa]